MMTTFFLDSLVHGAGPGNHGSDYAMFRPEPKVGHVGRGAYQLYTIDWIKRGRPTSIEIQIPGEDE